MMDDNGLWRMMDDDGNDDGSDDRNNDGSDDGNDDGNGDGSDDGNDDGNDGGNEVVMMVVMVAVMMMVMIMVMTMVTMMVMMVVMMTAMEWHSSDYLWVRNTSKAVVVSFWLGTNSVETRWRKSKMMCTFPRGMCFDRFFPENCPSYFA
jgi:hypothetical protein